MMERTEGYFRGKNNFELFFQGWVAPSPSSTIIITHGLGEHSDSYLRLVNGLLDNLPDNSTSIYCWDMRGHGRSEGKRGVAQDFSNFSDDLHIFINTLKKEVGYKKLFLSSHSMGGLVTLNTLIDHPQTNVAGAIFSSPLIGVGVEVPSIKQHGAKYLAQITPSLTMWNEIKNEQLTHEKKIIEEFEKDPLRHDRISPKLYLELLAYTEKIQKLGHRISIPILFQISPTDSVVNPQAAQIFFKTLASTDKTISLYENSHHEIYNDIERTICFEEFSKWIQSH